MAKFKGYEERLINSAYEIFKEAYDDVIKMGLDRLPEVPDIVNIGLHFFHKDVRLMLPLVVKHSIVAA